MNGQDAGSADYQELRLIKESEKSTIHLVQKRGEDQIYIRKILRGGGNAVYPILKECHHPFLPGIYEVGTTDGQTVLIEEYIEGIPFGSVELSEKQVISGIRELCDVLEFLHGKGIIHRDIKPSNLILAKDGHIRLIDFDAARILKEDVEQDTRLLGTRGYAPPEQYGFAQTDERSDLYALGMTMKLLLGERASKKRYRKVIQKCTDLDPNKRYQSAKEVRHALSFEMRRILYGAAALLLVGMISFCGVEWYRSAGKEEAAPGTGELAVLPEPGKPHWEGETGIAVWDNVPESGDGDGEVAYNWRLYRMDTETPPDLENDEWDFEGNMRGNGMIRHGTSLCDYCLSKTFAENGYYYFAVSAVGDDVHYTESPYAMSDAFFYTGESAPVLPAPENLAWKAVETDNGRVYYATWSNLEDYEEQDDFNVCVYDRDGNYVMNNIWTKEDIIYAGYGGIRIRPEFLSDLENAYRFTVEVYSSRPNEYRSYLMPESIPEECYSPWFERGVNID